MEIMIECSCIGKKLTPNVFNFRSDILIKQENLEKIRLQVEEVLTKNQEVYVNQFVPGKFGKNDKINFIFVYSIIDKYIPGTSNAETESAWTTPEGQIHLVNVGMPEIKAPIIQKA